MSRFDPPSELPMIGRLLYWLTYIACMSFVAFIVVPWVHDNFSIAFGQWVGNVIFGPIDAASP